MAHDLDSLTEERTLTMTGRRRSSATQTRLKFVSALMAVLFTRVGPDKGWRLDWGKYKVSITILLSFTLFHRNGWR